jgi:ribonucleoside-triphosphate reductase
MITNYNKLENKGNEVLLFYIPDHCAGCKRVKKMLEDKNLQNWTIHLVDSESGEHKDLIEKYDVKMAPTLVVFKDGEPLKTIRGLKEFIENRELFVD